MSRTCSCRTLSPGGRRMGWMSISIGRVSPLSRGVELRLAILCFRCSHSLSSLPLCRDLTSTCVQNWDGIVVDGVQRSPIQILCADGAPCTNIQLQNVKLWSSTGKATNKCRSAYGNGAPCMKSGSGGSYSEATTTITQPAGYTTPPTMSGDLAAGFPTNSPIPIP